MKKNLLTVLILALMIVNIVLTTVVMVSVISTNKKTAELVGNVATALNVQFTEPGGEGEAEQAVPLENVVVYALPDDMMVQVPTVDGGKVYFIFKLSLSMDSKGDGYKKLGESITSGAYDTMIMDQVSSIVAAHTEEECNNDIESIKREILQAIQDFTGYKFVYKINISGVKFS